MLAGQPRTRCRQSWCSHKTTIPSFGRPSLDSDSGPTPACPLARLDRLLRLQPSATPRSVATNMLVRSCNAAVLLKKGRQPIVSRQDALYPSLCLHASSSPTMTRHLTTSSRPAPGPPQQHINYRYQIPNIHYPGGAWRVLFAAGSPLSFSRSVWFHYSFLSALIFSGFIHFISTSLRTQTTTHHTHTQSHHHHKLHHFATFLILSRAAFRPDSFIPALFYSRPLSRPSSHIQYIMQTVTKMCLALSQQQPLLSLAQAAAVLPQSGTHHWALARNVAPPRTRELCGLRQNRTRTAVDNLKPEVHKPGPGTFEGDLEWGIGGVWGNGAGVTDLDRAPLRALWVASSSAHHRIRNSNGRISKGRKGTEACVAGVRGCGGVWRCSA